LRDAINDWCNRCIATHHLPHEYDAKVLELNMRKFGMTGWRQLMLFLNTSLPDIPQEKWIHIIILNPRKVVWIGGTKNKRRNEKLRSLYLILSEKWTVKRERH